MKNTVTFEHSIGEAVQDALTGVHGKVSELRVLQDRTHLVGIAYADQIGRVGFVWRAPLWVMRQAQAVPTEEKSH